MCSCNQRKLALTAINTLFALVKSSELLKNLKTCRIPYLKGQCHEIFCFCFFSSISFPPSPECPIRTVSNFSENSRRYSQVKVHHRYQRHRWQFTTDINDTGGKFASGVYDWRFFAFATGVVDTGGKPWAANISANFRKKFETTLVVYSGAWGKLIHKKNQKSKISWHCPFKPSSVTFCQN